MMLIFAALPLNSCGVIGPGEYYLTRDLVGNGTFNVTRWRERWPSYWINGTPTYSPIYTQYPCLHLNGTGTYTIDLRGHVLKGSVINGTVRDYTSILLRYITVPELHPAITYNGSPNLSLKNGILYGISNRLYSTVGYRAAVWRTKTAPGDLYLYNVTLKQLAVPLPTSPPGEEFKWVNVTFDNSSTSAAAELGYWIGIPQNAKDVIWKLGDSNSLFFHNLRNLEVDPYPSAAGGTLKVNGNATNIIGPGIKTFEYEFTTVSSSWYDFHSHTRNYVRNAYLPDAVRISVPNAYNLTGGRVFSLLHSASDVQLLPSKEWVSVILRIWPPGRSEYERKITCPSIGSLLVRPSFEFLPVYSAIGYSGAQTTLVGNFSISMRNVAMRFDDSLFFKVLRYDLPASSEELTLTSPNLFQGWAGRPILIANFQVEGLPISLQYPSVIYVNDYYPNAIPYDEFAQVENLSEKELCRWVANYYYEEELRRKGYLASFYIGPGIFAGRDYPVAVPTPGKRIWERPLEFYPNPFLLPEAVGQYEIGLGYCEDDSFKVYYWENFTTNKTEVLEKGHEVSVSKDCRNGVAVIKVSNLRGTYVIPDVLSRKPAGLSIRSVSDLKFYGPTKTYWTRAESQTAVISLWGVEEPRRCWVSLVAGGQENLLLNQTWTSGDHQVSFSAPGGEVVLRVECEGNLSDSFAFRVDRTPPVISPIPTGFRVDDESPTVECEYKKPERSPKWRFGAFLPLQTDLSPSFFGIPPLTVERLSGNYSSLWCKDFVGNNATLELTALNRTSAFNITLLSPPDNALLDAQPTFSWNISGNLSPVLSLLIVGNFRTLTERTSGQLSLSDGFYQWKVEAMDRSENKATSETRSFVLDTSPPRITILSPANGSLLLSPVNVSYVIQDLDPSPRCWWKMRGPEEIFGGGVLLNRSFNLSLGSWTFEVTCQDWLNHTSTTEVEFSVVLPGPPISGNYTLPPLPNLTVNLPPEVGLRLYDGREVVAVMNYTDPEGESGEVEFRCLFYGTQGEERLLVEGRRRTPEGSSFTLTLGRQAGEYYCKARAFDGQAYSAWAEDSLIHGIPPLQVHFSDGANCSTPYITSYPPNDSNGTPPNYTYFCVPDEEKGIVCSTVPPTPPPGNYTNFTNVTCDVNFTDGNFTINCTDPINGTVIITTPNGTFSYPLINGRFTGRAPPGSFQIVVQSASHQILSQSFAAPEESQWVIGGMILKKEHLLLLPALLLLIAGVILWKMREGETSSRSQ